MWRLWQSEGGELMLWSIIPEDTVFAGVGTFAAAGRQAAAGPVAGGAPMRMEVEGCPCEVVWGDDGGLRVAAVCSTDPQDFMRKNIQPGQRILLLK